MLHGWMIFRIEITPRLLIAYKGCMTVVLAVCILINKFRFFKLSRMAGNFINEKFAFERLLMHFLIVER
jgi:predicted DNA-binding transcriptional regulator YafY